MQGSGKNIFLTGIGTEVGKTVVAAILVEALGADYWKPVQAGNLHCTDTDTVRSLVSPNDRIFHPEAFRLQTPMSPHRAAELEGTIVTIAACPFPRTDRITVVEGAGGVFAPLNEEETSIDLAIAHGLRVIVVSRNYLGSLNHTLLTVEALQARELEIAGLVINGEEARELEDFLERKTGVPILLRVRPEPTFTPEVVARYAKILRGTLINGSHKLRPPTYLASFHPAQDRTASDPHRSC